MAISGWEMGLEGECLRLSKTAAFFLLVWPVYIAVLISNAADLARRSNRKALPLRWVADFCSVRCLKRRGGRFGLAVAGGKEVKRAVLL